MPGISCRSPPAVYDVLLLQCMLSDRVAEGPVEMLVSSLATTSAMLFCVPCWNMAVLRTTKRLYSACGRKTGVSTRSSLAHVTSPSCLTSLAQRFVSSLRQAFTGSTSLLLRLGRRVHVPAQPVIPKGHCTPVGPAIAMHLVYLALMMLRLLAVTLQVVEFQTHAADLWSDITSTMKRTSPCGNHVKLRILMSFASKCGNHTRIPCKLHAESSESDVHARSTPFRLVRNASRPQRCSELCRP